MKKTHPYYSSHRAEVTPFLPDNPSRVLEIGCGTGGFRDFLPKNVEYWGVEPVADVAQAAREKMDFVHIGTYDAVKDQLPNEYFDLVICNDVIEHMQDHDAFLEQIKDKMAHGGFLCGSIPNVRHFKNLLNLLIKKDWEYTDAGILDRTHLRFFTRKSLIRAFDQNGFEIEMFKGINDKRLRFYNPFSLIKYLFLFGILGIDTRPLQFGFRVRKKDKAQKVS